MTPKNTPPQAGHHLAACALARSLAYLWAAPASVLGLLLAVPACAVGASVRLHCGVVEVAGGWAGRLVQVAPARCRFAAITLGHVVLGQSHAVLDELRAHEHEHVRQYERWGALFFVVYLGSSATQWLMGRGAHEDNRFERMAREAHRAARAAAAADSARARR